MIKFKNTFITVLSLFMLNACQNSNTSTPSKPDNNSSSKPNDNNSVNNPVSNNKVSLSINGENKELFGEPIVRVYNGNFIELTQKFKTSSTDTTGEGKFYVRYNSKSGDINMTNPDPSKIVQINELTFLDQRFVGVSPTSDITKWEIKREGNKFVGFIKKEKDSISSGCNFEFSVEIPKN